MSSETNGGRSLGRRRRAIILIEDLVPSLSSEALNSCEILSDSLNSYAPCSPLSEAMKQ